MDIDKQIQDDERALMQAGILERVKGKTFIVGRNIGKSAAMKVFYDSLPPETKIAFISAGQTHYNYDPTNGEAPLI